MIYNGLTVLTEEPNRREDPNDQFNISKIRMDSTTGPFTELAKAPSSRVVRDFNWYMPSRADIALFDAFMAERAGALVPFWVPTWQHDLQLAGDVLVPSVNLDIINIGYSLHQFDAVNTWRRHLAFIEIGVGIQFIIRIDGTTENITTETLTLNSVPPQELLKGQWMLSFLTLCRLESDTVKKVWRSKTIAECTFQMRELPGEMPTTP